MTNITTTTTTRVIHYIMCYCSRASAVGVQL